MKTIIVTSKFVQSSLAIRNYIYQQSPQSAEKFRNKLKEKVTAISKHPTAYPPVPQLPTKKNWYRYAIFLKSYKIIFKVVSDKIIFLSIVHMKQNPELLKDLRTSRY